MVDCLPILRSSDVCRDKVEEDIHRYNLFLPLVKPVLHINGNVRYNKLLCVVWVKDTDAESFVSAKDYLESK